MDSNEFIQRLFSEVDLGSIDWASDVERILVEQVVYLRDHLVTLRQDSVLGAHEVIAELYQRLDDKDRQIDDLHEEIRFLRDLLSATAS